jgi:hypothetical protein
VSFTILDHGEFELEASSDLHSVNLSESTLGLSINVPVRDDFDAAAQHKPAEKINVAAVVRGFLATPMGTLSMIVLGVLVLLWGTTRFATALRR